METEVPILRIYGHQRISAYFHVQHTEVHGIVREGKSGRKIKRKIQEGTKQQAISFCITSFKF